MKKAYKIEKGVIVIDRDLTELDKFVKDFLDILKKHSDYLIVSGFVSISTGRTRGTEDVDILIPFMEESKFNGLFEELIKKGFWCYQGDNPKEVYFYIKRMINIRFSRKNEMFPNMEFVPINKSKKAKHYEFTHSKKIRIKNFEFKIPPIEFEIIYKERILAGKKDIGDAQHLRNFFKDILKKEKFKEYEKIIKLENENLQQVSHTSSNHT